MVFVNYKCYPVISSVCFAADFQVGFQLAYLFRTGKVVVCSYDVSATLKLSFQGSLVHLSLQPESRSLSANSASTERMPLKKTLPFHRACYPHAFYVSLLQVFHTHTHSRPHVHAPGRMVVLTIKCV